MILYPCNLRRDKYNRKLKKYYVIHEEGDDDLSEEEEQQIQRDEEALINMSQNNMNNLLTVWYHHQLICSVAVPLSTVLQCSFRITSGCPQVADDFVQHKRLGAKKPDAGSDSEGNESEQEKDAKQINTAQKEL